MKSICGECKEIINEPFRTLCDKCTKEAKEKRKGNIKTLLLYATNKCNLSCSHCFYHKDLNTEMQQLSIKQIEQIVKETKPKGITLCGGEPMLRNDLLEICKILDTNGVERIGIMTNGFLVNKTKKVVEEILKNVKATVNVNMSLDGLEKTHNKIRRNKLAFKTVVETTKELRPFLNKYPNFQTCVRTVVMKENYRELEKLSEFIDEELKIPHFFELIRGIDYSGVPEKFSNLPYNPEEMDLFLTDNIMEELKKIFWSIFKRRGVGVKEYFRQASQYKLYILLMDILRNKKQIVKCTAGEGAGVIYPNGDVALCEYLKPVGNINNKSFNKIWNSKEADEQREIMNDCYCTHGCFVSGCVFDKKIKGKLNRLKAGGMLIKNQQKTERIADFLDEIGGGKQ